MMEEQSDVQLIEQARNGEREAFGELFRRHHAKAYGWAKSYMPDPYSAEDIVQEALMKAFVNLGTLLNTDRFVPWLQRIVRNQAYNKLNAKRREQPFSSLEARHHSQDSPAWGSLDSILFRLRQRSQDDAAADPAERLIQKETLDTIQLVLQCLTKRERAFFESYFFGQLTPKEIAELFQTTTGNVYMVLSRSKKKIAQERMHSTLNQYISKRRMAVKMKQKILDKPRVLHWKSPFAWSYEPWTTAGFNMFGLLEATQKNSLSIAQVLGLTGQAFRLNIAKDSIHTAGATLYDWNRILSMGMRNLGFRCKTVGKPSGKIGLPDELPSMEVVAEALELIQNSLEKGQYVMSFDLTLPEFGIIYGYSDDEQQLYVGDVNVSFHRKPEQHERLPYGRLGRNYTGKVFALAITDSSPVTRNEALVGAVRMILDHANGNEPAFDSCANGLSAYDAWIEAFRKGQLDPDGNSYTTELVHDARQYAAQFLKETAAEWEDTQDQPVSLLLREASQHYEQCAGHFRSLCGMFPFAGKRLSPNDPAVGHNAISLLAQAKAAEEKGLVHLQEIHVHLTKQYDIKGV